MTSKCGQCSSERLASIVSKSSDCNSVSIKGKEKDGYVPRDMGIGGGDTVEITWCLDCGQMEGKWPLPPCAMEDEVING